MKKILMFCSIAFVLSCSNDSDIKNESLNVNESSNVQSRPGIPTIDDDIDQLFYNYINSDEFINSNVAHDEFFEKLNYSGDYSDIETKGELILWINQNISLTQFQNSEMALSELNSLLNLKRAKYNEFRELYLYIENAPVLEVTARFDKWFLNENTTNSETDCAKDYKSCKTTAHNSYTTAIKTLKLSDASPEEKDAAATVAEDKYKSDMKGCKDTYKLCEAKK
ncbi:hypothetical protein MG290_08445 [Flavobacterium sp. CBA20B-1]|uniref:hypothetical protein n=1 Tax=unclassified Flavobacterium TaxID=196869 RepID=UPI00222550DC|nr:MULTISPECIES: hypothetical protein [unclassified Flavobacterium]WCM40989.1 hypothetical protein MG290_08445 [Flavobacterium sp. CBA20B-1]